MPEPVTNAIDLVEDAVTQATGAAWDVLPVGTVKRLLAAPTDPAYRAHALVAHSQDAGGRRDLHVGSDGWTGLITVRCYAPTVARARAGFAAAVAAMATLTAPDGYAVHTRWEQPLTLAPQDGLIVRAGIWRVTIRRVGLPAPPPAWVRGMGTGRLIPLTHATDWTGLDGPGAEFDTPQGSQYLGAIL